MSVDLKYLPDLTERKMGHLSSVKLSLLQKTHEPVSLQAPAEFCLKLHPKCLLNFTLRKKFSACAEIQGRHYMQKPLLTFQKKNPPLLLRNLKY